MLRTMVQGVLGMVVANVDVLEFGNWGARKTVFGSRCAEVQAEMNRILDGGSSDSGKRPSNLPGPRVKCAQKTGAHPISRTRPYKTSRFYIQRHYGRYGVQMSMSLKRNSK